MSPSIQRREREFRNLMSKPYTEPVSLVPSISKVNYKEIQKQGVITVVDALNYVPGGLTETRGRQVKQLTGVMGRQRNMQKRRWQISIPN